MQIRDHRGKRVKAYSVFGLSPALPRQQCLEIRSAAVRTMPRPLRVTVLLLVLIFPGLLDLPRYLVPELLRRGLCPTCGYPLPKRVNADGCSVCPECGSAWRPQRRTGGTE
jgi:hypothetical protein